jgi:hypothetical protein
MQKTSRVSPSVAMTPRMQGYSTDFLPGVSRILVLLGGTPSSIAIQSYPKHSPRARSLERQGSKGVKVVSNLAVMGDVQSFGVSYFAM